MLLSIVIPTHNRSESLRQCLEAIVVSIDGRDNCEVIVVDDHSRGEIGLKNRRLCARLLCRYFFLEKNQGAAGARNFGIEMSAGEWIAFIDDDVCVEKDWFSSCLKGISGLSPSAIGLEGCLLTTSDGVWDKEVENQKGKAYLTSHIFYRKSMLQRIGGFDGSFKAKYPACEDHELAVRALIWGDVVFDQKLRARHLPRKVNYTAYVRDFFIRMKTLLDAEFYFFHKHRDRYHTMRFARTFWGTYKNIALFHLIVSLKRRSARRLFMHPFQSAILVCTSFLEQMAAIFLMPFYVCQQINQVSLPLFFTEHIDDARTRNLWRMDSKTNSSALRLSPFLFRSLFFAIHHRPVYSLTGVLRKLTDKTSLSCMRVFLRIDDIFLHDCAGVKFFCEKISERKIPFCAGITGNDLADGKNGPIIDQIRASGGEIALHGFTHSGRFGPYKSELLQMNFHKLGAALRSVGERLPPNIGPSIFIPPYNAISRELIAHLTHSFKIICGGPETARFTDCFAGPIALNNNAWYFPSFFPFYNSASAMVQSREFHKAMEYKGFVCITVHMPIEARDNYQSLMRLIDRVEENVTSWNFLLEWGKK